MLAGLFALILILAGCATGGGQPDEYAEYDAICEQMAEHYRSGRYGQADLIEIGYYCRRRIGTMTASDMQALLGEPRVLTLGDSYYGYALIEFYGLDTVSAPDWAGGDQHDQVWHYSESGPPEHHIADESSNLFFIIKDGRVIALRTLS